MSERENILGRIREALRNGTPAPSMGATGHGEAPAEIPGADARAWLPLVGPTPEEQLKLFAVNCADLKASFELLNSRDELKAALLKIRDREKWQRIATHDGELSQFACKTLALPALVTDKGYDVQALEQCDVAITECDLLIAQTGGLVVTSRSTGGRALSVLPPHHVVVARRDQLVADLPTAFAWLQRKYAPDFPSMISFITGPSRTGDIERIMVLGAHGPKKLTILCL